MRTVNLAYALFRQVAKGIWESVEEIAATRPDVPPAVLDLVRAMVAADDAECAAAGR